MKKPVLIIFFNLLFISIVQAEIKDILYDGKEIFVFVKKDHMTTIIFPEPINRVIRGFAADTYVIQRNDKEPNTLEIMPTNSEVAELSVNGISGEDYVLRFVINDNFYTKLIIRKMLSSVDKNEGKTITAKMDILPETIIEKQNPKVKMINPLLIKSKNIPDQDKTSQDSNLPSQLNMKITLKGNDLPLKIYLSTISQVTGYNIITTPDIDSQKTSINLEDIEVWRALKSLLYKFGYGFKISRDDLIISDLETRIYTIKSLPVDQSFLDSTSNESFSNSQNANNSSNSNQQQSQYIKVGSRIYYENSASKLSMWADLENNIKSILSTKNGTYSINRTNGMLIVTDKPGVLDKVGEIITAINENLSRQQSFQIEIYEIALSNSRETGIDWDLLVKNMKGLANITSATHFTSAGFIGGQLFSLATSVPNPNSGVSQSGVNMVVKALEEQGSLRVISKPSITVTNMYPAVIQAVTSIPYISGTGSTIGTNLSQTNVTTSQVSDGLTMRLEAKIEDQKTILNISVVENSLDSMTNVPVGNGLTIQEPQVSTKSITTNVEIEDTKTLILGGLISDTKKNSTVGIPYLSRIPFLGNAFQYKNKSDERDELVIFISPNRAIKGIE